MMYKAFLVKYAEIGIKGKNRHLFEKALWDESMSTPKETLITRALSMR